MKIHLGLPDDFFEALRQGSHSTRIERQEDALLAVVNDVIYNFEVTSTDISTLWANADHRLLVTARAAPAALGGRAARRRAPGRGLPLRRWISSCTCCAIRPMCWYQIVRETGVSVDQIEDRLRPAAAGQPVPTPEAPCGAGWCVPAAPAGASLRALFRSLNRPPAWLREADLQALREATEEFSLVLDDLAALVERI